jgi:hypothetical protein
MPCPIDRKLAIQADLRACSRALPSEGSRIAISNAIIEITTSNSISVNAEIHRFRIANPLNNFLLLLFSSYNFTPPTYVLH